MLVTVKQDIRRYYVGFEIDNRVRFEKGPNKGKPQTVTSCKIYLVPSVRGKRPTYIAGGTTVLGKKDTPNAAEGLKFALTRALDKARLGRYVNALIWADFQLTHRRIDTINIGKPSNAELFSDEPVHDNCGHKFSNVAPSFAPHAWIAPANFGRRPDTGMARLFISKDAVQPLSTKSTPSFYTGGPIFGQEAHIAATKRAAAAVERVAKRAKAAKSLAKVNKTPDFSKGGPVHGYGGLHSFQKQSLDRVRRQGRTYMHITPRPGLRLDAWKKLYGHRRHEYSDIPFQQLPLRLRGKTSVARTKNGELTVDGLKTLHGLGWVRCINTRTGEQIWPRTAAMKMQQLRDLYSFGQAESRCHRVGEPVKKLEHKITIVNHVGAAKFLEASMGGAGAQRVRDILKEADRRQQQQRRWLEGVWAIADDQLTARMKSMQLLAAEEALKVDAMLLSRPGITKVHDEYIIDPDKFVSEFKVGDTVTWVDGGLAKITGVDTIRVTIQPVLRTFGGYTVKFGPTETVMDWEVEKNVHWLKRLRKWFGDTANWLDAATMKHSEIDKPVVKENVAYAHFLEDGKPSGDHGLYNLLDDDYCSSCHGTPAGGFLRGPSGGSCLNVKCSFCGQRYWIDPATRTAKKLDD